MNDHTGIEWTDATWNPVTGCTKVSKGCDFCYAERDFPRVYGNGLWKDKGTVRNRRFTDVATHPDRLGQPLRWRRPRRIFVNSMSDLFHPHIDEDFVLRVWVTMGMAPRHTFQVLTKRPERALRFLRRLEANRPPGRWPLPNVWIGVSVENQEAMDSRAPILREIPAARRFLSCEPLLGRIDAREALVGPDGQPWLDWMIVGGESGPRARAMHPDWVRALRDLHAVEHGRPFFFKQWGEWAPLATDPPKDTPSALFCDGSAVFRVGRRASGRVLDGRTWDEFPRTAVPEEGCLWSES